MASSCQVSFYSRNRKGLDKLGRELKMLRSGWVKSPKGEAAGRGGRNLDNGCPKTLRGSHP